MGKTAGIIILVACIVLLLSAISLNNRIVALNENVNATWAQVETALQRRYDLIPNLVNTVKGYAKHESGVLEEVTRLRSQWAEARTPEAKVEAAAGLEGALGRLMVVVEKYPDLKASQNFIALQDELSGTENRIAVQRQRYNEAVREYNTGIAQFPASVVAGWRGFKRRDVYFESAAPAKQAPKVEF